MIVVDHIVDHIQCEKQCPETGQQRRYDLNTQAVFVNYLYLAQIVHVIVGDHNRRIQYLGEAPEIFLGLSLVMTDMPSPVKNL